MPVTTILLTPPPPVPLLEKILAVLPSETRRYHSNQFKLIQTSPSLASAAAWPQLHPSTDHTRVERLRSPARAEIVSDSLRQESPLVAVTGGDSSSPRRAPHTLHTALDTRYSRQTGWTPGRDIAIVALAFPLLSCQTFLPRETRTLVHSLCCFITLSLTNNF